MSSSNILEAWRKGYFSNYIKELDKEHQEILTKITELTEEIKTLQQIPKTREAIYRALNVAKQQKDQKSIEKLQKELEQTATEQEALEKIKQIQREIEELSKKFAELPFKMPAYKIIPYIKYRTEAGTWIYQSVNKEGIPEGKFYYYAEPDGVLAVSNFEIETDENGIPRKMKWILQDSSTYGLPLKFERDLILEQPIHEKLKVKTVEKEVIKEIPEIYWETIPISMPHPLVCPSCKRPYESLVLQRLYCANCGRSYIDSFNVEMKKRLERAKKDKTKHKEKYGL